MTMAPLAEATNFKFALLFCGVIASVSLFFALVLVLFDSYCQRKTVDPLRVVEEPNMPTPPTVTISDISNFPWSYWCLTGCLACSTAVALPWTDYGVTMFDEHWGMSIEEAGRVVAASGAVSIVFAMVFGFVLDRYGKRIHLVIIGAALLIPGVLLLMSTDVPPLYSAMFVGVGFAAITSACFTCIALIVRHGEFGTALGVTVAICNTVVAPVYYIFGLALDLTNEKIDKPLWMLTIFAVAGLAFASVWIYLDKTRHNSLCGRSRADLFLAQ
eukprot:TRINITY_DN4303_c0_g1_i1.p1 TRINITY_DN4303_c0_g1~~TRINITY_DN4303_c0_g1_i1.p1  ORF type:complete len:302 (-),score=32.43 TRINITY_DN4303_c0_g1_i1:235-1050(-)